ncbi:hypothetical protein GCM10011374_05470 [Kocuria dechangensis]|uniref:DUF2029 domain-containing protein n=1 Tax=Kocuria dechangensis TaxID=1176249 RepID=A0A917GHX5_9MICC|nr:glycosyltransferase 87 family protein [Kocuria dechangensis]GGG46046.1 hypothetical protein GCM10011374_05470 [Kocuria dechangensis]
MSTVRIRRRGGGALLVAGLVLYAAAMAWLLRLPCRAPGGGERFPDLCAGTAPAGGSLLASGPDAAAPPLVGMITTVVGWFAANLSMLLGAEADRGALAELPVLLLVLVWLATVLAVHRSVGRGPDALVMAIAPAVLLAGFTTWDLWAVLFLVLALLFHARGSCTTSGVFLGLGASVALFPVAALLAVLFLAARRRQFRDFALVLLGAVLTWALVNGPSVVTSWDRWTAGLGTLAQRPVADSSFWGVWGRLVPALIGTAPAGTGQGVLLTLVLCLLGVLVAALVARQDPGVVQVSFLVLAVFVLFGTDYSLVQVLWLVPLVVLARRRWPEFAAWQLVELAHWAVLVLPGQTWPELPWTGPGALELLAVLRLLFLVYFVVVVTVDLLRGRRATATKVSEVG